MFNRFALQSRYILASGEIVVIAAGEPIPAGATLLEE